jgi:hypothetical protein
MRSTLSKLLLVVAGCIVIPLGPTAEVVFSQQADDFSRLGAPTHQYAGWGFYFAGIAGGLILVAIGRMIFPKALPKGLVVSQIIDIAASLVCGTMTLRNESLSWLSVGLGFAIPAYIDYVTRFLSTGRTPASGPKR